MPMNRGGNALRRRAAPLSKEGLTQAWYGWKLLDDAPEQADVEVPPKFEADLQEVLADPSIWPEGGLLPTLDDLAAFSCSSRVGGATWVMVLNALMEVHVASGTSLPGDTGVPLAAFLPGRRKERPPDSGQSFAPRVPGEVLTIELSLPRHGPDASDNRLAFKLDPVMEKRELMWANSVWREAPPGTPHPLKALVVAWRNRDNRAR